MDSRGVWFPILIGLIATPACYLLGVLFSGFGHYLYAMIIFFPYAMLLGLLIPNIAWFIALPTFALQYPLYGAAFGAASMKDRFRALAIGLAVAHFLAMLVGFVVEYARQNQ